MWYLQGGRSHGRYRSEAQLQPWLSRLSWLSVESWAARLYAESRVWDLRILERLDPASHKLRLLAFGICIANHNP